ncbi:polyamine aminopropyltransferase [Psychrobium sp. 1_MG-2023]|uniref:polyamine aminopropyltransferase n=1 Tax=Psychrobium sp. 1_MG-2023 TaxID=3062624 RepID=UPI000C33A459|nr:polyamine aminopropyltransferase [Psychrobium sp. 1_MG-2023]MDP2561519.1 polyamine aminopropyltransferase [Psychrobium sp. 1_MG-2023]PKF54984.1 spermidine synthase [Alteromonadales bacterium alter-6D02]
MNSNLWIEEKFEDFLGLKFKVEKVLFSGKSEYQTVDIVETKGHGKMLLNDGLVMVTERDEFAYHDMISHVPLFTHPAPKNVLIIGGGDGGTAREVLRHCSVEKCTMVEIDSMVVDACKEFIPQTAKDLDHDKLTLIIGDGVEFVKNTTEKFDVIIVDSTDPIGPAQPLFGEAFYRDVYDCLSDDGIVVSQGESSWYALDIQQSLLTVLNAVFPQTYLYSFSNLTYPGGLWSFTFATKKHHPINDLDVNRVTNSGLSFDYYNANLHSAAFALPNFVRNGLAGLIDND